MLVKKLQNKVTDILQATKETGGKRCKEQLNLHKKEFGTDLIYCFYCELEEGHDGAHRGSTKGWTETFHKRNQIVCVYWFEKENEESEYE